MLIILILHSEGYDCGGPAVLTAMEKATEPTPLSKVPRPISCRVTSVLESQMWTHGWSG